MPSSPSLVWFRKDLRVSDNPALLEATKRKAPILPIYILDDENAKDWRMGAASRWWLLRALNALNTKLDGKLVVLKGKADDIIPRLISTHNISHVYWNRCYEPWRIARDKKIKSDLAQLNVSVETFQASLLWEPWQILKSDQTPYRVFTPFYRKGCVPHSEPRLPLPAPTHMEFLSGAKGLNTTELESYLLPQAPQPRWNQKMEPFWTAGEDGAAQQLESFLARGLKNYKEGRNFPFEPYVSRLSPYLQMGEISPHQVWHAAKHAGLEQKCEKDLDHFHSELGWREFSYYLLYHFPTLPNHSFNPRFDAFPWNEPDPKILKAWQMGQTGYPIVDAGMRELYETGYMHNRVRMIVGSFLVKHLLIHWHHGEHWFWDKLVDADLASNSASWQWVAGCGADAAPYFRIFNPILQGEKFDPNGDYVRKWVPEVGHLSNKFIHKPWESSNPPANYPAPVVDHEHGRARALKAFEHLKDAA
jgi:deoxyribodipyrimidine photo-lyase